LAGLLADHLAAGAGGLPGGNGTASGGPEAPGEEALGRFLEGGDVGEKELEGLLHWAVSNSDPSRMSAAAAEHRRRLRDDPEYVGGRRERVQELVASMSQQPTDFELMEDVVAVLRNAGESERHPEVLAVLADLLAPIDNANDFPKVDGGLATLVAALDPGYPRSAAAAAHALGTAAANNPEFQEALLNAHPDLFRATLALAAGSDPAAATKGLYATSALVRNSPRLRVAFLKAGGLGTLQSVLRKEGGGDQRTRKKALNLVGDLARVCQEEREAGALQALGLVGEAGLVEAMLEALEERDWDLREKGLVALGALLDAVKGSERAARAAGAAETLGRLERELRGELKGEGGEFLEDVLPQLLAVARRVQPQAGTEL